ncbi:MAG: DSD1 family PLP-dependent enzyme [Orrella sp.]
MQPWQSCQVGDHFDSIDTPSLVLMLDAFERNLDRLMQASGGLRVRPHAKSHKCPEVAKRQIARGAVGICCQKLSEAACFAQAGIHDILITNQVVGDHKLKQLRALAERVRLGVLVDDVSQVTALARHMANAPQQLDVYIEVEVGGQRCGAPVTAVVELAQLIQSAPGAGLRFAGLHCYHGRSQHFRQPLERAQAIAGACEVVQQALTALRQAEISVDCVTGAGTGTFWHERDSGLYSELQPGSYAFMDRDYGENIAGPEDVLFENALFVKSTVMSTAREGFAIVDAGLKASSVDAGQPKLVNRPQWQYLKASDEHGVVALNDGDRAELGESVMLIPGHCDPTINLYDEIICVKNEHVHAIWPITARGALL